MRRCIISVLLSISLILLISGCTEDKAESKSMEQLHKENGVPVRVEKIGYKPFVKELAYHSAFSGVEQTSKFASFGGRVEKIYKQVGDRVQKGEIVVSFPQDIPGANYFQAKTAYENAKQSLDRLKNLKRSGGVSQQAFDNAEMQYNVAKANWDVVRESIFVPAPISGIISKISVSETENVKRDAELFTVSRINELKARIWVTENEIFDVKNNLPARAIWRDLELTGKVDRVDLAMNTSKQSFGAMVRFANPKQHMLLGITSKIFIETYRNDKAIVVDRKNILSDRGQFYVYVNENGRAHRRPVQIKNSFGLQVEISDGLSLGEEIITEGLMLIEDGTKINIIE